MDESFFHKPVASSYRPLPVPPGDVGKALAPDAAVDLDSLRAEIDRLKTHKTSLGAKLGTLVITGLLFIAIAGLSWTAEELIVLIVVLILHEAGHAAGMFLFGYQDISMFFLPGFGAAVSGRKESAPAWQQAVVSLAGPLPGLFLALVLWPLNLMVWNSELVGLFVIYLAFVNLLNLLPFFPLDGGHFFNHTLFSRQIYLEAAFTIFGALGLAALAVFLESWFLGVFAFFALAAAVRSVKLRMIARELEPEGAEAPVAPDDTLLGEIDAQVRRRLDAKNLKLRATGVTQVLDRMGRRPPTALATVLLLLLYVSPLPLAGLSVLTVALAESSMPGVLPPEPAYLPGEDSD